MNRKALTSIALVATLLVPALASARTLKPGKLASLGGISRASRGSQLRSSGKKGWGCDGDMSTRNYTRYYTGGGNVVVYDGRGNNVTGTTGAHIAGSNPH